MAKYFKKSEFSCFCCGANKVNNELIIKLDIAREMAGIPFIVNSGYRCEKHNEQVGGSMHSAHLNGMGADIRATDSRTRWKILNALYTVGFNRIGIHKRFIHCDIDETLEQQVTFLY